MTRRPILLATLLLWTVAPGALRAGVQWGGCLEPGRDQNLRLSFGVISEFEGMIAETRRKLYDVTGNSWKQEDAERYSTSDFNLDGSYQTMGFSLDMAWSFIHLQLDSIFLNPATSATAQRDYYIAISDSIEYQGRHYDHLMIPEGAPFNAELFGNMTELNFLLVPVGFTIGDFVHINPSWAFGLVLFGGRYEIEAGSPRGATTYQNPPEEFVIGGETSGLTILGAPQWGPGIDLHLGSTNGVQVRLRAQYLYASYDGGTGWFTTADHREKNLDFSHKNLRLRGQVEIPLNRVALTIGLQAQFIETDGTVSSSATDPADILARRERFDKDFSFRLHSLLGTIGITF